MGKTSLLAEFSQGKQTIHYQCENLEPPAALEEFWELAARVLGVRLSGTGEAENWYGLFRDLAGGLEEDAISPLKGERTIIIFDEVQHLLEPGAGFLLELRRAWDDILSKQDVMLILCGPARRGLERALLGESSLLAGAVTGQLKLEPLAPHQMKDFFPDYLPEDHCRVYGVCGGVPGYLRRFDPWAYFPENLQEQLLSRDAPLYQEGEFLLKMEFREYRRYLQLLRLMAKRPASFGELTRGSGLEKGAVSKYLSNLMELDLVTAERPATDTNPGSRRARYRPTENFLGFWLGFVFPGRHHLQEQGSLALSVIQEDFEEYMEEVFSQVCRHHTGRVLGSEFPARGAWWTKKGDEIPVVAANLETRAAVLGTCRWSGEEAGPELFNSLLESEKKFQKERRFKVERYLLFSRGGFSPELEALAAGREDLTLVGMQELEEGEEQTQPTLPDDLGLED